MTCLRNYSTMKVGGTAKVLLQPATKDAFRSALQKYPASFILGGGSNVVFPDGPFDTPIIFTGFLTGEISVLPEDGGTQNAGGGVKLVTVDAGVTTDAFVDFCLARDLGGAENFAGLPGTVGGAVFMNARCYDREMSDLLAGVGETGKIDKGEWGYKKSPFQPGGRLSHQPIFDATFALHPLDPAGAAAAREKAAWCRQDRREKGHFRLPSCGSVFKNNHAFGAPTGKIIADLGLRGRAIGGAQIAPWHGNIIVNTGTATAADVRALVELVETRVSEARGFRLEREVLLL